MLVVHQALSTAVHGGRVCRSSAGKVGIGRHLQRRTEVDVLLCATGSARQHNDGSGRIVEGDLQAPSTGISSPALHPGDVQAI